MKDIKNCIVGVLVKGKLRGTGYLVSDELIITSAHVLTDGKTPPESGVDVRFHCNGEEFPVSVSKEVMRHGPNDARVGRTRQARVGQVWLVPSIAPIIRVR